MFKQKIALLCFMVSATFLRAQPLHQPLPMYTNDPGPNRTGHSSYVVNTSSGFMEYTLGGIAVNGTTHFLAQNANDPTNTFPAIVVEKKHANNGTSLGINAINIGLYYGSGQSMDRCNGIVLDPVLNRAYVYGFTNYNAVPGQTNAFVMCFDMSTLLLVNTFGTWGITTVETNTGSTGVVGFALTGSGNNFLVAFNKGTNIQLEEYTPSAVLVRTGTVSNAGYTYEAYRGAMKKSSNGHYFLVGSSTFSGQKVPMVWDVMLNTSSTAYIQYSSSSPSSTALGQGYFTDFDFYVNPAHASMTGYLFDLLVVGNDLMDEGIYAKYIIQTSVSYNALASFTNQAGSVLPGKAIPSNTSITQIKFTKCTMAANGYLSVLGYSHMGGTQLLMGYLSPTGNLYNTTYQAPGSSMLNSVHKAAGITSDGNGNIIVSGCTVGKSYTTIKLSNTYDCTPVFNLKGSSTTICQGDNAILNANISTPGCTMTWKTLSPTVSTIYSGLPASIVHVPNATTIYECTVTNTTTGCSAVQTRTVTVLPTSPGFSITTNTSNSSYYTVSAIANEQFASTVPGFGYAWILEELTSSNANICTFSNPSCWWIPLTTPTVFNGVDFSTNSYSGSVTIANCSVPTVGKFLYGHRYKLTRGTWSTSCAWKQQSIIIEITLEMRTGEPIVTYYEEVETEGNAPISTSFNTKEEISVFPNPTNGIFNIESNYPFESDFYVYDASGKLLLTQPKTDDFKQVIKGESLNPGLYLGRVMVNGAQQTIRIIVSR